MCSGKVIRNRPNKSDGENRPTAKIRVKPNISLSIKGKIFGNVWWNASSNVVSLT